MHVAWSFYYKQYWNYSWEMAVRPYVMVHIIAMVAIRGWQMWPGYHNKKWESKWPPHKILRDIQGMSQSTLLSLHAEGCSRELTPLLLGVYLAAKVWQRGPSPMTVKSSWVCFHVTEATKIIVQISAHISVSDLFWCCILCFHCENVCRETENGKDTSL